jgi:hypothetical protein
VTSSAEQVARIVRRCLAGGRTVEIDGLGSFRPGQNGAFRFVPRSRPRIFMAYVVEDRPAVERLYDQFTANGFDPWLDCRKLMAGQNWPRAIDQAISIADFFVACLSRHAVVKKGPFQSELRYALDCARRVPLEDVFFIPVRLEDCRVPVRIAREFQYVDLFPDWDAGLERLLVTIRAQVRARRPPAA